MSKFYGLVCLVFVILLAQAAAAAGGALVLNPQADWREGCGVKNHTDQWTMESLESGAMRFAVSEADSAAVWNFPARLDVDPEQTPILSMTYRAAGLSLADPGHWVLVFYGGKPSHMPVVRIQDLVDDGEEHTLKVDLREAMKLENATAEALKHLDVRVYTGESHSELEIIDLRFEPAEGQPASAAESLAAAEDVSVRVVNEAGQPLVGATVVLDSHLLEGRVEVQADAEGLATLTPQANQAARATLAVTHEGMTRLVFRDLKDVSADIPLTATLYPTATYGGVVVDEAGEPIAGVTGELWTDGLNEHRGPGRPTMNLRNQRVVTDSQGRWSVDDLPVSSNFSLKVRWMHPDYLSDRWGGQFSGDLAMADLREGTARSVLHKGIQITGQVFDRDGQPLANAYVAQGNDRFPSNAPPATHTDAEGRFTFNNTQPGGLVLTVTAKDHAPQLIQTTAAPGIEPIDFRLEQAAVFRFRVVDSQGQPVANASVCPDTWKGFRTIPGRVRTDDQGEVTWHGPHDPVEFDVFASKEYNQQRGVVFSPSTSEDDIHVITLGEPLRVTATVTDAQTGEPITQFSAIPGILWGNGGQEAPYYERYNTQSVRSDKGEWEHTFGIPKPFRMIRIEAEGYAPAVSEPFTNDAGHVQLTFALEPAEALAGTLVDAAGQPVPGVSVYLSMGSSAPYIRNGRVERNREHPVAVTDAEGGFAFPPQGDQFLLIALHDAGYVEMTGDEWIKADGKLALQPWGRISGRVLVGDQPGAGENIGVWINREHDQTLRRPYHDIKATADAQGNFTLDRIPPGKGGVGRQIKLSENSTGHAHSQRFDLAPGESLDLQIGGTGRPIVGKFVWPEDAPTKSFAAGSHRLSTRVDHEARKAIVKDLLPEGFEDWSAEEKQAFAQKEDFKALNKKLEEKQREFYAQQKHHNFRIEADGTFRIENVEPGEYDLNLSLMEPPVGNQCGWGEQIGHYQQTLTVPALPEGQAYLSEAMELGEMQIVPIRPALKAGEAVPAFSLPVLPDAWHDEEADGQAASDLAALETYSSDDMIGQVTLIYFGASWCGPCHGEAPFLKETWNEFKDHPSFAMLSVSLDQGPKAAVKYAKDKEFAWPQLFVEGGFQSDVVSSFGVRGIPSIWVIGPNGNVLNKDLRGASILPAVRQAVGSVPATAAR